MRSQLPQLPRRQTRRQRVARGTAEIIAGFVLGVAAIAVADTATTSADLRLGTAITIIVAVVAAEWGLRVAARRVRRRDPSSNSQVHNLSKRGLSRRFRRG